MWLTLTLATARAIILGIWFVLRPLLGWTFIVLGVIGMPLPIVNGLIFLVLGLALIGPRNKLIRWSRVHIKLLLARWAALPTPVVGPLGRFAQRSAQQVSRQHRRVRWWWMERRARSRAAAVGRISSPSSGD
jgi:hypothetical protein